MYFVFLPGMTMVLLNSHKVFNLIIDPYDFRYTHFFPGLGFMVKKYFWWEVKKNWPNSFWDEYFRSPNVAKNRTCLYPEISRVSNFGIFGASGNEYFKKYVLPIRKNIKEINYDKVYKIFIDKFG